MSNNQVTVTKRVTEEEIGQMLKKGGFTIEEIHEKVQQFQLQTFRDLQSEDVNYEIVQPKQLNQ